MNKAEVLNKTSTLPEEDVQSAQKAMNTSLTLITDAIGEDGKVVLDLIEKVKKSAALREDPSGTVGESTKMLWALLMGSDAEKEKARQQMDALAEANSSTIYNPHNEEDIEVTEEKTAGALDELEISIENTGVSEESVSSLLQQV